MNKAIQKLFQNGDVSASKVGNFIEQHLDDIKKGLEEDTIGLIIDFFVSPNSSLTNQNRQLILHILVPNAIISAENVEKLLFWLCSNMNSDASTAAIVLTWLEIMVRFKLIDQTPLEEMYGFLIKYFRISELVKPLSKLLIAVTNPKLVTKNNVFLVSSFYNSDSREIGKLLALYHSLSPNLVPVKPKVESVQNSKEKNMSTFEKCIKQVAQKIGLPTRKSKDPHSVLNNLPLPEYDVMDNDKNGIKKISDISSMYDLGRNIMRIKLPHNLISLLSSKEGLMYLVTNGPDKKFLMSLASSLQNNPSEDLLKSIAVLQEQLMHGLPQVTDYLADFLVTWDGKYLDQIIYSLIPWLFFDTFDDLEKFILTPLTRVYVSSNAEVKVQIVDALTVFITNMVSVHIERYTKGLSSPGLENAKWLSNPTDTIISLCKVMHKWLNVGVCLEGMDCTLLINKALNFYHKLLDLQTDFALVFLSIVPPIVVYGALFSLNCTTLCQLCSLITKYKENVMSHLTSMGVISQFQQEVECIESYAANIFSYLWRGEEGEDIMSQLEFSALDCQTAVKITIGKRHLGIYPFVKHISSLLEKNPEDLSRDDLLVIYSTYAGGVFEFLKCQASYEQKLK